MSHKIFFERDKGYQKASAQTATSHCKKERKKDTGKSFDKMVSRWLSKVPSRTKRTHKTYLQNRKTNNRRASSKSSFVITAVKLLLMCPQLHMYYSLLRSVVTSVKVLILPVMSNAKINLQAKEKSALYIKEHNSPQE